MQSSLAAIKEFLGPYFFSTLITAAFGAFAGAWVVSRRETKRDVKSELNKISTARQLCFSMCNKLLAVKGQQVLPLHRDYFIEREEVAAALQIQAAGSTPTPINNRADFESMMPLWLPVAAFQDLIFKEISMRGRGLSAAVELVSILDQLEQAILFRNDIIKELRSLSPLPTKALIEIYYGLPITPGLVDERIMANVQALYAYTDDCIFFSRLVSDDLFTYGTALRKRYARWYRLGIPKLSRHNWAQAEALGLVPHRDKYFRWLRGFPQPTSRLDRVKSWFGRLRWSFSKGLYVSSQPSAGG